MTSMGRKIASHTVGNYISALTDSCIFYPVQRYDAKGKQLLKTGRKQTAICARLVAGETVNDRNSELYCILSLNTTFSTWLPTYMGM